MCGEPSLYFEQPRLLGGVQLLVGYIMQQGSDRADDHTRPFHSCDQRRSIPHPVSMEPVMAGGILAELLLREVLCCCNQLCMIHYDCSFMENNAGLARLLLIRYNVL